MGGLRNWCARISISLLGLVGCDVAPPTGITNEETDVAQVSSPDTVVDVTPPSVPVGLTWSTPNCGVTVAWAAATDNVAVRGYRVYVDGTYLYTSVSTSQVLRVWASFLLTGVSYAVTVAAYDDAGNVSAQSQPITVTPPVCASAPTSPTGLSATALSCKTVRLSWGASSAASPTFIQGYVVKRNQTVLNTVWPTLQMDDTDAIPGTTATYQVFGNSNTATTSPPASVQVAVPACTDTVAPSAPGNLRINSAACGAISLAWTAATDNVAVRYYKLYRDGTFLGFMQNTVGSLPNTLAPYVKYRFEVSAVDTSGNESSRVGIDVTPDCSAAAPGTLTTAIVLVHFSDEPGEPYSPATAAANFFGSSGTAAFINEATYSRAQLTGNAFGWYTMARPIASYCPIHLAEGWTSCDYTLLGDAATLAAANVPNFASYTRVIYVIHGMAAAGFGGGNSVWVASQTTTGFALGTIAHELGHTFGLMHAGGLDCPADNLAPFDLKNLFIGGCYPNRYTDTTDVMGGGNGPGHYSVVNKEMLGATQPSQIADATSSGTFTLDQAEFWSSGIKEVRVPLEVNGYFYSLEYRRPVGFDQPTNIDGVQVRLRTPDGSGGDSTTLLIPILLNPAAPAFADKQRGIRIEVLSKNSSSAVVQVQRPDFVIQNFVVSPQFPNIREDIVSEYDVKNQGLLTSRPTTTSLRIGGQVVTLPIPALAPGQSFHVRDVRRLPIAQNYVLVANVNSAMTAPEGNTTNNEYTQTLSVYRGADLVIASHTVSPANPSASTDTTFTVVVKNQGDAPSTASRAALQVGGETLPSGFAFVPSLNVGGTFSFQIVRRLTANGYVNRAFADYDNQVSESDETNNQSAFAYTVGN